MWSDGNGLGVTKKKGLDKLPKNTFNIHPIPKLAI
jgi:hypothetical protein